MNEAEIRKDWLAGKAVVAFVGALFTGQVWEPSEATVKLLPIFAIPSDFVVFLIIAAMSLLSLFLILATIVTRLQRWAVPTAAWSSQALVPIVLVAFFVSLASAFPELPHDQWWSRPLRWGGLMLLLLLMYRQFDATKSTGTETTAGSTLVYGRRDIGGWSVPSIEFLASGRTLEAHVKGEVVNEASQNEELDHWRRKVMSTVRRARRGKSWNSNDEHALSIGLRFHPGSHEGSNFNIDNYTRATINAIAAGLFSDAASETVDHWDFPDSNFKTLLIHRLSNADDASEEGAAIFVSSWRKKPSLKERCQALLRVLFNYASSILAPIRQALLRLFRTFLNRVRSARKRK